MSIPDVEFKLVPLPITPESRPKHNEDAYFYAEYNCVWYPGTMYCYDGKWVIVRIGHGYETMATQALSDFTHWAKDPWEGL